MLLLLLLPPGSGRRARDGEQLSFFSLLHSSSTLDAVGPRDCACV